MWGLNSSQERRVAVDAGSLPGRTQTYDLHVPVASEVGALGHEVTYIVLYISRGNTLVLKSSFQCFGTQEGAVSLSFNSISMV